MASQPTTYRDRIRAVFIDILRDEVTTGREQSGLVPFTMPEFNAFLAEQKPNIDNAVEDMFLACENDGLLGNLQVLGDVEYVLVLYEYVNIPWSGRHVMMD